MSPNKKLSDRELLETQSPYYRILRRMSEDMEQRFNDVLEIFNAPPVIRLRQEVPESKEGAGRAVN